MRRLIAALFIGLPLAVAAADRPSNLQSLPDAPPPPPPGLSADDANAPQITIKKRGQEKVEEYRVHGKLYMIKVTPAVGKPYYLIDQLGDGTFARKEGLGLDVHPPLWVVHEW